ncbi:FAD-dependent oxidoreductase [Saccharothrix coeruleofusca]|uniref:ferredoxin--NADP(+) reductase n=1 Tax=Saccharothrix coeruleofusca TaxID=33919 RepID=A0A918AIW3_9PSEU|nr:FAD-dependent oxidoreductase [Saccharothrix coeruleofusca]MBP2339980.1 ferredoxin--NADP+ reductase [Saccharothrix coeruleofusca]GGP38180.1 pyridine nucleotide-disulfide oxidoreductase [Saccharothrix coeruleofusca]
MSRSLRVAVVGAGPAGIYAADILTKSEVEVSIDLFERMPAPYGLIRYGVAPDHPRIKGIVTALQRVLDRPEIRFFGNVEYGVDLKLDDLRQFYDAVIFSTGAEKDRPLDVPGIDLPGSFGAADFVSWYDGHPDVPRTWPLTASSVAVLGVGNVALDVARILAKTADELLTTEIPDNVYQGLKASPVTDVHVFGRRGPAQAKFTPLELRELDHSPNVEVVVHPEGIDFDAASMAAIRSNKQVEMVVRTLQEWAIRDVGDRPRKLHLHFLEAPVAVLGEDAVTGLRTERMELTGDGGVRGTGEFTDWPVQAVYRAVGYLSTQLADLPFDHATGTVPHAAGRVLDLDEQALPGVYVTGWIKRGPIGLIGHTKGDALETITSLLADADALPEAAHPEADAIVRFLEQRAVPFTTVEGWRKLDAHEIALGAERGRERIKVVDRESMTAISRS